MTERMTLPNRRGAETFEIQHRGHREPYRITVHRLENGEPAEVFVHGPKVGSEGEALGRDCAILLSLSMQYRIPLDVIRGALTREEDASPSTIIGSVVDLLVAGPPTPSAIPPKSRRERLREIVKSAFEEGDA